MQQGGIPEGILCAGGTRVIRELTPVFRVLLVAEMAAIYIGAPLAVTMAVHDLHLPVFIALMPVLGIVLMCLLVDPTFSIRRELTRGFSLATLVSILGVFAVAGGAVAWYVATYHPAWFLEFPRNRPETYTRVMLLYPAMSVVVQELVYRTFFFHRYGALFGRAWWLAIIVNAVLFGFGHVVIGSDLAVYGSMVIGALFAYRYVRTRSFWAVFIEHTLWGALVFTVGLGRFFFTGVGIVSWR